MAIRARAGVAARDGAMGERRGERARGGPWRLGLQSCARVVHIGLGQSLHGGRDARIFEAEVCLVCIVLYRFRAFVPIWTSRHFFFRQKCAHRIRRAFVAVGS